MGFASDRDATLKLKPVNASNWNGILDPRLVAPTGINNWETRSAALFFAGVARGDVADGDGWNLLEACGLVPYKHGKPPKPDPGKAPLIRNYTRPGQ